MAEDKHAALASKLTDGDWKLIHQAITFFAVDQKILAFCLKNSELHEEIAGRAAHANRLLSQIEKDLSIKSLIDQ